MIDPALVDETANIADAARKIVWGAMAWGGQWCTSPGYAYVHESVGDAFAAEAKKAVIDLYGRSPRTNPDHSRVIGAREVSRLATLIDPAKVTAGGQSDPDARYLDPTIEFPVTLGKFPDPRMIYPVNWRREMLDKCLQHSGFALSVRLLDARMREIAC